MNARMASRFASKVRVSARTGVDDGHGYHFASDDVPLGDSHDIRVGNVVVPGGRMILMFLGLGQPRSAALGRTRSVDLARDPSGHVGYGMNASASSGPAGR